MNPDVQEITTENPSIVCNFCKKSELNTLEWGPMYKLGDLSLHYFCLLFSSGNLPQEGKDDEGILGFLPEHIIKEVQRGNKLKCAFCKLRGASIGCCIKKCKISTHYTCGLSNKFDFQFIGKYESFCSVHRRTLQITLPKTKWWCVICRDPVTNDQDPLLPLCCEKQVFHKTCALKMAASSGAHFFKCPICMDREIFSRGMALSGVFIPNMDAAWETEPNAFAELLQVYSSCDAYDCKCPKGKNYCASSEGKAWSIVRCKGCGGSGIHMACGNLENMIWCCATCAPKFLDEKENAGVKPFASRKQYKDNGQAGNKRMSESQSRVTGARQNKRARKCMLCNCN